MHGSDVRHHSCFRLRDLGEARDFTPCGHPHLQHGNLVSRFEREQRQGQAVLVVQVPLGLVYGEPRGQQCGDQFLSGRLAGAPGDANHVASPFPANRASQVLKRPSCIAHRNEQRSQRGRDSLPKPLLDHSSHGAAFERLRHKLVPIEAPSPDGKEQRAGSDRSRVDRIAAHKPPWGLARGAQRARHLTHRQLHRVNVRFLAREEGGVLTPPRKTPTRPSSNLSPKERGRLSNFLLPRPPTSGCV